MINFKKTVKDKTNKDEKEIIEDNKENIDMESSKNDDSSHDENRIINKFKTNVFTSVIALFSIKFLGFIYRALLFNIDGYTDEANGYYSAGYELYALILAIIATGIPNIISRITAEKIGEKNKEAAYRVFKVAVKFFGILSAVLSVLLFISADAIATHVYKVPEVSAVIKVLAPAIFFVSISAIIRGHFTGTGNVKPSNRAQLLEQILNCSLTILFAYIASGRPPHIIAAAANVSTTISVILAFTYLMLYWFKIKKKSGSEYISLKTNTNKETEKSKNRTILKEILKITLPITIGAFIGVFNIFIDSVTVTRGMQKALSYEISSTTELQKRAMGANGVISKVNMIVTAPQVLSQAFANILITSVAFYAAKKAYDKAAENITSSLKVLLMFLFPAMIGIIALAGPILKLIFPAAPEGEKLLMIYAVSGFFVSLNMVLNSAMNGLGKVKVPPIIIFIGAVVKVVLNVILIPMPKINIFGSPIASLASQLIIFVLTWMILRKYVKASFGGLKYISKILVSSTVLGLLAFYTHKYLNIYVGTKISTMLAIILPGIVYFALILLLKAVDNTMLEKIPVVNKLVKKEKLNEEEKEDALVENLAEEMYFTNTNISIDEIKRQHVEEMLNTKLGAIKRNPRRERNKKLKKRNLKHKHYNEDSLEELDTKLSETTNVEKDKNISKKEDSKGMLNMHKPKH